jgi:hypothetical protein
MLIWGGFCKDFDVQPLIGLVLFCGSLIKQLFAPSCSGFRGKINSLHLPRQEKINES